LLSICLTIGCPLHPFWDAISAKHMGSNGQRTVSQKKVRELQ